MGNCQQAYCWYKSTVTTKGAATLKPCVANPTQKQTFGACLLPKGFDHIVTNDRPDGLYHRGVEYSAHKKVQYNRFEGGNVYVFVVTTYDNSDPGRSGPGTDVYVAWSGRKLSSSNEARDVTAHVEQVAAQRTLPLSDLLVFDTDDEPTTWLLGHKEPPYMQRVRRPEPGSSFTL